LRVTIQEESIFIYLFLYDDGEKEKETSDLQSLCDSQSSYKYFFVDSFELKTTS